MVRKRCLRHIYIIHIYIYNYIYIRIYISIYIFCAYTYAKKNLKPM